MSSRDHKSNEDGGTSSSKPNSKGKNAYQTPSPAVPPKLTAQEDKQVRPVSREMPGTYIPTEQAVSQGQPGARVHEEWYPNNSEPEQRQDRAPDQKYLRESMREGESKRGHGTGGGGSLFSGLSKKLGRSVQAALGPPIDGQYAEPESFHDDRGGRFEHRGRNDEWRDRRQNSRNEEVFRLRQDIAEKDAYIDSLRSALESEKLTTSKVKLSADKMQLVMDNKDLFVGAQHNDDVILTKFRNLFGQIRTWSKKFGKTEDADFNRLDAQTRKEFERVAPGCLTVGPSLEHVQPQLWNSAKKIRGLIQGWVGLVIVERMFRSVSGMPEPTSTAKDVWMGDVLDQSTGSIEYKLAWTDRSKITLRELHDWRSLTVELLSRVDTGTKAEQQQNVDFQETSNRILNVVGMWAPPESMPDLHDKLQGILYEAMTFSQLLRRQRACWTIRGAPPTPPNIPNAREGPPKIESIRRVPFDYLIMKDRGEIEDDYHDGSNHHVPPKTVELFTAPGLFKRGDADGAHFETDSCMSPIQVLCFEQ